MDPEREYLSKKHAAITYDVSVGKLETEIRAGRLRSFNVGRKILLKRTDLEEWIASCAVSWPDPRAGKSELKLLVERAVESAKRRTA